MHPQRHTDSPRRLAGSRETGISNVGWLQDRILLVPFQLDMPTCGSSYDPSCSKGTPNYQVGTALVLVYPWIRCVRRASPPENPSTRSTRSTRSTGSPDEPTRQIG